MTAFCRVGAVSGRFEPSLNVAFWVEAEWRVLEIRSGILTLKMISISGVYNPDDDGCPRNLSAERKAIFSTHSEGRDTDVSISISNGIGSSSKATCDLANPARRSPRATSRLSSSLSGQNTFTDSTSIPSKACKNSKCASNPLQVMSTITLWPVSTNALTDFAIANLIFGKLAELAGVNGGVMFQNASIWQCR